MSYVGWKLPDDERAKLLSKFFPMYPDVIAHHVTLRQGKKEKLELPTDTIGTIVGIADDDIGVQALVVEINGTTRRPDGNTYHITWSIDRAKGAKPVDSNRVIRESKWDDTDRIEIRLEPKIFD